MALLFGRIHWIERQRRKMMYKTRTEHGWINLTIPVPASTWADTNALAEYLARIASEIKETR
jgi:hypothetical protein